MNGTTILAIGCLTALAACVGEAFTSAPSDGTGGNSSTSSTRSGFGPSGGGEGASPSASSTGNGGAGGSVPVGAGGSLPAGSGSSTSASSSASASTGSGPHECARLEAALDAELLSIRECTDAPGACKYTVEDKCGCIVAVQHVSESYKQQWTTFKDMGCSAICVAALCPAPLGSCQSGYCF